MSMDFLTFGDESGCRRGSERGSFSSSSMPFSFYSAEGQICLYMEHPQYPTWLCRADVPSVWCLAAVRALRTLCCLSITSFDQCTMGSIARKPTTILHLRLPRLRGALLRGGRGGRCAHPPRFHERLQGRGLHGNFKTSCGKIYPQKLNAIIADSIAAHLRTRFQDLALSAELPAVLHPLVCIFF